MKGEASVRADHLVTKAVHILSETESRIRRLAIDATSEGAYETSQAFLSLLCDLGRSRAGLGAGLETSSGAQSFAGGNGRITHVQSGAKTAGKDRSGTAPSFSRTPDGSTLVLRGLKKTGGTYTHRAERSVLEQLIPILEAEPDGIEMNRLNLKNPDETPVPPYKPRTVIRWLKSIEAVRKDGHRYLLTRTGDSLRTYLDQRWLVLPPSG
jgi:hypothetical protein